jgi:hypothetical protein
VEGFLNILTMISYMSTKSQAATTIRFLHYEALNCMFITCIILNNMLMVVAYNSPLQ